jgi:hypothetical protein
MQFVNRLEVETGIESERLIIDYTTVEVLSETAISRIFYQIQLVFKVTFFMDDIHGILIAVRIIRVII